MSWLFVGLGNPGSKYEMTRHNIGFLAVEDLGSSWKEKFKGLYTCITENSEKAYLLKPQTFMNLSGESIQPCAHFFKIDPKKIVIIHDEIDLPFGTIQLKVGGGLAGHNGLKSTAEKLGTKDFKRIRLGVGRPVHGSVSSFVLQDFDNNEKAVLDDFINLNTKALLSILKVGFEKSANEFSRKKIGG